ncbi:hypothetical protein ACRRTK_018710 [Alexandromys fortis]
MVSGHGKYESGQRMNGMKTGGKRATRRMTSHNCPPHYMSRTNPNSEGPSNVGRWSKFHNGIYPTWRRNGSKLVSYRKAHVNQHEKRWSSDARSIAVPETASPFSGCAFSWPPAAQSYVIRQELFNPRIWCANYDDQHSDGWYIWFLMMILLVVLLCGLVLLCLQSWLKRCRIDDPPRRTVAVFAVGDLDLIYEMVEIFPPKFYFLTQLSKEFLIKINLTNSQKLGTVWNFQYIKHKSKRLCRRETEMAGSPTSGIGLPAPNTELGPAPCFSALGPPPPYEETLKTS